jgi:hypothetical protein
MTPNTSFYNLFWTTLPTKENVFGSFGTADIRTTIIDTESGTRDTWPHSLG